MIQNRDVIEIDRLPSLFEIYGIGVLRRRRGFVPGDVIPRLKARKREMTVDVEQLQAYARACELEFSAHLPMLYPFMSVFSLHMRMLTDPVFPLSFVKMMQLSTHVLQHRPIAIDEVMDVTCEVVEQRARAKGLEVDCSTVITVDGERRTESINTYFYPGRYGRTDSQSLRSKLDELIDPETIASWTFPRSGGWKFAQLSFDLNGIHYSPRFAKFRGFRRDFSHSHRSLASILSHLPQATTDDPLRLDILLKGPVYYGYNVELKGQKLEKGIRFDLFCGEDPRPCVRGRLVQANKDETLV